MSSVKARVCVAVLAIVLVPMAFAAQGLNPPKVADSSARNISLRQQPGFEARCFKESTLRERGEWTNPTKSSSDYVTSVELRNGVEFLTLSLQLETGALKVSARSSHP